MSATATASTATTLPITVKSLNGDLVRVDVDPSTGLGGVVRALNTFDRDAFPLDRTVVSFLNEEAKELSEEEMLIAFVKPYPMTRLMSVEEVEVEGSNASVPPTTFKRFTFELPHEGHPIVYIYTHEKGGVRRFLRTHMPMRVAYLGGTPNLAGLYSADMNRFYTLDDVHVIVEVLRAFFPDATHRLQDWNGSAPTIYCECGCIVKQTSLKAHLKSKGAHIRGDAKNREFLARLRAYVESLCRDAM